MKNNTASGIITRMPTVWEAQRKHESGRDFEEDPRTRMRWYGHVMRRVEEFVGKRVKGIEVQGSRRRGGPKKRWADCVKDDLREREGTVRRGGVRPSCMEATIVPYRPHVEVG